MSRTRIHRFLPLALAVGLLLAPIALAQSTAAATAQPAAASPEQAPQEGGSETVDVEVVSVEVYVTDDDGRTVDGLTRDDFKLLVDHGPVAIDNFYRASEAGGSESVDALGRQAPAAGAAEGAEPLGPERLTLVLYVDHVQLTQSGRRAYLDQIREFLGDRLTVGDQLMVVSHDRGLVVEERFTGDLNRLEAALKDLWKKPAGATEYARQYQQALDQIENILVSTPQEAEDDDGTNADGSVNISGSVGAALAEYTDPCGRVDQMLVIARSYGSWVASQVERSITNLQELTRALGGMPGRKAVLYLSEGLDQTPGLDFQYQVAEICPSTAFQTVGNDMGTRIVNSVYDLASLANSEQVTFYTLDAARLRSGMQSGIERAPRIEVNGRQYDLRPSASIESQRRQSRQASLQTLALETGGLAVFNANQLGEDLERIEDSLRSYYSLGFRPQEPFPGAVHTVKVELDPPRKGHTLHYRRTYVDQEPMDENRAQLLSALLLGYEENPLGVTVEIGDYRVGGDGNGILPLRIVVPFNRLAWLQKDGFRDGKLELMVGLQDGQGGAVGMRTKTIPIRIKEDLWPQVRERTHPIELALPVPSDATRFAFALVDRVANRTSFLSPQDASPSG